MILHWKNPTLAYLKFYLKSANQMQCLITLFEHIRVTIDHREFEIDLSPILTSQPS